MATPLATGQAAPGRTGSTTPQRPGSRRRPAPADTYQALYQGFAWKVPRLFNIAQVCCHRWARQTPEAPALLLDNEQGERSTLSYRSLQQRAGRLSNALQALGIGRGDRVAIVAPQGVVTAVSHMAIYQMGAVAMPMSVLFGPEALQYRYENSGCKAAIVDAEYLENTRQSRPSGLQHLIVAGPAALNAAQGEHDWQALLARSSDRFTPVRTLAEDPAVLIYTSGTTGPPKGALIAHRSLIGNLTGFVASQDWFPQAGDVFWSPADWAWTGGLMDAFLPTLYFGKPIVAYRGRFGADVAFDLMSRHRVTNAFLFPTALKMMMKAEPEPLRHHPLVLRALMSAGESLGDTVFDWCEQGLAVTPNEMFGQTEINYVVGNSSRRWPARPGAIGKAYPGHRVALIDEEGQPVGPGQSGEIAVHRNDIHGHPDPVFFLGYWRNDEATRAKFSGPWCRTGDLASADEQGYLWYAGRADDMFKSAGYRIGPSEIENCMVRHEAVANVAVVPKPDAARGNLVKAYVVVADHHRQRLAGTASREALVAELQAHVRGKLAPYEYPKEIEFIDALPMTTTGKVQRRVLRLAEQERASG